MTKTELYEKIIEACGGDPNALPDKLETTELACILGCLGGNLDELEGKLCGDILEAIAGACPTGGGGSGEGVTIRNQNKTITKNGSYKADSGYTGLGTVTVNVPQEDPVLQDKTATQNGKYTADSGFDGLGTVTVAVPDPVLQDKTVTENGTVTADSGYDGLGQVTVNVAASGGGGGADIARAIVDRTITEYNDSKVTTIAEYAFHKCAALTHVDIPNVTTLGSSAFWGCTALEFLDLRQVSTIPANAVYGAKKLKTIALRKTDSIVTLGHQNAFWGGTPFDSGGAGGVLLVPSTLRTTYIEATNWSVIYGFGKTQILSIEDYTVDGTVTGEIDWDKVNALFA